METLNEIVNAINGFIWHDYALFVVLGVGILFTVWSGFGQYRALTHGIASLFARGDAARRKLQMTPEELLEAGYLIYLDGLGKEPTS